MCATCKVHPINDLTYKGKQFQSDFTYIKRDKKSHIDFILTNKTGLNNVLEFSDDWHLSDHRPVALTLRLPHSLNVNNLYSRALDLNAERLANNNVVRLTSKYNYDLVSQYMDGHKVVTEQNIITALNNNDPETAITYFNKIIQSAHNQPGCKQKSIQRAAQNL